MNADTYVYSREKSREQSEYEQARGSAAVVAWLVGGALVTIFVALFALLGAR